ncbi:nuclear transport factor 2 family protein [Microbacterium sp. NPDC091313]
MPAADPTDLVVSFYTRSFNDAEPEAAAAEALGDTYAQHNPGAPDGAAAFIGYVHTMRERYPQLQLEVKRTISDGEYVWTHSRITLAPGHRGLAVADIWRVADGRIVEHWDVIQEVPEQAANANTMF